MQNLVSNILQIDEVKVGRSIPTTDTGVDGNWGKSSTKFKHIYAFKGGPNRSGKSVTVTSDNDNIYIFKDAVRAPDAKSVFLGPIPISSIISAIRNEGGYAAEAWWSEDEPIYIQGPNGDVYLGSDWGYGGAGDADDGYTISVRLKGGAPFEASLDEKEFGKFLELITNGKFTAVKFIKAHKDAMKFGEM